MASRIPPEISAALADRSEAIRARAAGRVLEVDEQNRSTSGGEYDTVISIVRVPHEADLGRYLRWIADQLAPDGTAFFLEPTIRTGPLGRALGLGGRLARPVTGLHLDRDLPPAIRRAGLFVTDLHRFEIASVAAPLRPFVEAWARFPTPPPD